MIVGQHRARGTRLSVAELLKAQFGSRLAYLLAPQTALDTLQDLSNYARGVAELKNGAALIGTGLRDGAAAAVLDGANDYIATNWATRTNMTPNGTFETNTTGWALSTTGWSATSNPREAAPAPLAALESEFAMRVKGTHEATTTTRFLIAETLSGTSGMPVKPGESVTFAPYVYCVDAPSGVSGKNFIIELQWYKADGSPLTVVGTSYLINASELARPSHIAVAPAEAAFVKGRVVAQSNVSGDTVDFWVDRVLTEIATSLGSYFPTKAQLESGEAGWSGTAHGSASDIGPFARGTVRTFVGLAQRDASSSEDALVGTTNASAEPSLQLSAGSQNIDWNVNTGGQVTWTNAWPGNELPVVYALTYSDPANTATLYIDGKLVSAKEQTATYSEPGQLALGVRNQNSAFFDGNQLPFAVFFGALTDAEVTDVYEALRATAVEAHEGRAVGLTRTLSHDGYISKVSALLDGLGSSSGQQKVRAVVWSSTGTVVGESEEIEIPGGAPEGWYDFPFADLVPWTKEEKRSLGLHFGGPERVARWFWQDIDEGFEVIDAYPGAAALASPPAAAEPLLIATVTLNPDLPITDDLYYARLGFYSAQERIGQTGPTGDRRLAKIGWHGTFLDPEPQGACFAIVDRNSDLADLVGERIKVVHRHRSVVAYVHRSTELDSDDITLSLSRRAFHALSVLSAEKLNGRVEVLS